MTNREKGLAECRKVKKILESWGFLIEGPGYKPLFLPTTRKMTVVHKDYFGMFDLLVMCPKGIFGIQVTTSASKEKEKIRNISQGFVLSPINAKRKKEYKVTQIPPPPPDLPAMQNFQDLRNFFIDCENSSQIK